MSKFKLILFDKFGDVRKISESRKCSKYTDASEFFVPFERMQLNETISMAYIEDEIEKGLPMTFHLLDSFEKCPNFNLDPDPAYHLFAVFGDNWFRSIKFELKFVAVELSADVNLVVDKIKTVENELQEKKIQLDSFKSEFLEIKRKFDEAKEKLDKDEIEIFQLLVNRESAYDEFLRNSDERYQNMAENKTGVESKNSGLINGIWSAVFGSK